MLTSAATTRVVKTILFIDFSVPLIYTNKVPFRVNILHQTLQAISILCPTIVRLKFNQCKLHVTNYLIFCIAPLGRLTVVYSGRPRDHTTVCSVLFRINLQLNIALLCLEVFNMLLLFHSNLTLQRQSVCLYIQ